MVGLVLAVAAGTLVASLTVSNNAAVVNGTAISQASFNSDLSTISTHPEFQCVVLAQSNAVVSGAGVGSGTLPGSAQLISIPDPATYSSQFTAYWLNERISTVLAQQWLAAHDTEVSAYARTVAQAHLDGVATAIARERSQGARIPAACASSAAAVSQSLPPGFYGDVVDSLAAQYQAAVGQAGKRLTAASVAAFYQQHKVDFDEVCSIVLPTRTQAEAEQVLAAVQAGTSFEQLAAANGGSESCGTPAGSAPVNQVAQVAAGLPDGGVSGPLVAGPGDYLLIQRLSSGTQPLSSVHDLVVEAMVKTAASQGGNAVANMQRNSHVWVDPRYGHWVPAPVFSLDTWHAPGPGTLLCPAANLVVSPQTASCPATPETGAPTVSLTPATPSTPSAPTTTTTQGSRKG
jgi:hypothetical protein